MDAAGNNLTLKACGTALMFHGFLTAAFCERVSGCRPASLPEGVNVRSVTRYDTSQTSWSETIWGFKVKRAAKFQCLAARATKGVTPDLSSLKPGTLASSGLCSARTSRRGRVCGGVGGVRPGRWANDTGRYRMLMGRWPRGSRTTSTATPGK